MSDYVGFQNPYGPSWRPPASDPNAGFVENFVRSALYDIGLAREVSLQTARIRELEAAAGADVPGFNPFRDASLTGYEDSLHLFHDARSPGQVDLVKARVDELRRRAQALEDSGASMSRFLAGMLAPENLIAMAAGGGVGGGFARRALAEAGFNVVGEGFNQVFNARTLPEGLQSQSPIGDLALAGLFGAAMGGLGSVASDWARVRAARYAAAHDLVDGHRTPGVPEIDRGAALRAGRAADDVTIPDPPALARLVAPGVQIDAIDLTPRQREAVHVHASEGLEALDALDPAAAARGRAKLDAAGDDAGKLVSAHDEIMQARWEAEARAQDSRLPLQHQVPDTQVDGGGGGKPPAGGANPPAAAGGESGGNLRQNPANPPAPPGGGGGGGGDAPRGRQALPGGRSGDNAWQATGTRAEKLSTQQLPMFALKNNKLPEVVRDGVRRLADRIASQSALWIQGAKRGVGKAISVEDRAKGWRARLASAQQATADAYYAEKGWQQSPGPVRAKLVDLGQTLGLERSAGMTFAEFRREVGKAVFEDGQHANPNVAAAATAWLELVSHPMGEEAARLGIIATDKHRALAMPALQQRLRIVHDHLREFQQLATALQQRSPASGSVVTPAQAGAGGTDPRLLVVQSVLAHLAERKKILTARIAGLADARAHVDPGYLPHRWIKEAIGPRRDEFVERLARWWGSQADPDPVQDWAPPLWRGEIAAAHVLGEKVGDTMERLVRRMMMGPNGAPSAQIDAMAAQAVQKLRALLVDVEPTAWKQEVRSALGYNDSNAPSVLKEDAAARAAAVPRVRAEIAAIVRAHSRGEPHVMNELVKQVLKNALGEGEARTGVFYRPHSALERDLNVPARLFTEFLETDVETLGQAYVRYMGASIETAREFGDEAGIAMRERLLLDTLRAADHAPQAVIEEAAKVDKAIGVLLEKVSGTYAAPENPDAVSVRVLQNLSHLALTTQMGQGLFAALTDVGRVQMAMGLRNFLRDVHSAAVTDRPSWQLAGLEAKLAGAAQEVSSLARWHEMTGAIGAETRRTAWERGLAATAGNMPFLNLVAVWTDEIKKFVGARLQHEFVDRSERIVAGTATAREIEEMAHYGIDATMARRIVDQYQRAGSQTAGPLKLASTLDWTDEALVRDFRAALAGAIDAAVVTPGAADRPNFMSGPLQSAIFMYKGFSLAATQRILMSGLQQRDARVLSGMLASLSLAWLLHGPAQGPFDKDPILSWERLLGAVDKSGVTGIFADANSTMEAVTDNQLGMRPLFGIEPPAYARSGGWGRQIGAAAGPAFAPWLRLGWTLTSPEAQADQLPAALRRLVPLNNALGINEVFGSVVREAESGLR